MFFLGKNNAARSDYARKYQETVRRIKEDSAAKTEAEEKNVQEVCPFCGGTLVLRVAKKRNNAGNHFYGCSNYPKCRYIRNVGKEDR